MSKNSAITFTVLGGGGEVGAACFQVDFNGCRVLLDCGTHPKKDGLDALPALSLLNTAPDALVVSHGHADHIGAVPFLLREFPLTRTYATVPTVSIMDRMLHNSVSVMETLAKERGIKDYPLYDHSDASYAVRSVRGFEVGESFSLETRVPVEAKFQHAGHVLGSASVLLRSQGHTLYYTADICETNQELMGGYTPLPRDVEVDTLIIECTRGATEESRVKKHEDEVDRLAESLSKVLIEGGCVLIPCFALGRMQEVLNIVSRLQETGRVPAVPVYASGLGRAVYEIYDRFPEYLKPDAFLRPLDIYDRIGNVWDPARAADLIREPSIIVATSGMMIENTPSAMIARSMVQHTHHGIFFVGYLDHETLGYQLLHSQPGDTLKFALGYPGTEVRLQNIQRFDFSAHAARAALKSVIERIKPKNVLYIHGDTDALAWMQENTGNGFVSHVPLVGQTIELKA
jgi:Cft2 family RNA processing exonuclease